MLTDLFHEVTRCGWFTDFVARQRGWQKRKIVKALIQKLKKEKSMTYLNSEKNKIV